MTSDREDQQPGLMSERRVTIVGAVLAGLGPASLSLFTPAMPEIVHAFGTTEEAVKMTLGLYFAGFALTQLVCGPLSDGYGRKPVTLAFLGIYLLGSLGALVAPSIDVLILSRLLQGAGAAVGLSLSRAIVRDLFAHEQSARILNLITLILALAPAIAPTVGGLVMEVAGWHAIFSIMFLMGVASLLTVRFALVETVERDPSRVRLGAVMKTYRNLLGSGYFLFSSLVIAGTLGAYYTQATVLPFILMDRLGLTPAQFGLAMLFQSASFISGSLVMRSLIPRYGAYRMVPVGLGISSLGAAAMAVLLGLYEPTFLSVALPMAMFVLGNSFVMPAMSAATVAAFPDSAGAASSLSGFLQMGSGLLGTVVAGILGDAMLGMSVVVPLMALGAVLAWLAWRKLPEPALARAVVTRKAPPR
ncbi:MULTISPECIES: multidrug effflux MFS transporter [Aminobacter]|jgi:DHA1 family bicyclomycin/chloramphenicol resistance-like MFS transporter|uniref:Bcr/CflA family efflux transporter n=3 Tax=Aminobacter TaxID=31988 RepID=A0ABR6HB39_AMIAI|nr:MULTISPECIES: multidrug effflux MFS transporter [Aminobacter]MBA8906694.1 DHA1 family bicyclomycin/chloramphenicol resistance-like MFS transporter [Aminobacter ciceronei]MBA9020473.1 DHA1 family bicyclomycin/chloramphenicol resistance-like MFS transporter [Aminobacter ciceronei]MBB3707727.1 DHA1 family bicyclomycin/chloramphenicol resistance-like MFS transporter [Aminobacter aminovorans]MRX35815.1 Bcr/CflA family efflux MFS transporter [Aminobacter sp. MDW-2]QNH32625.1 multidrug effflux MFS